MQIQLASPPVREDGDFTVYVNGSGMKKGSIPFAVIQLDENGSVDLTFHEPGDLDRLITAACQAKSLLVASRTPHPYRGADTSSSRCGDCGVMKGHHPEPEPDPAAVLAEAIKNGTPVIVADDEPAPVCGRCKNAPADRFFESGAFCEPCVDRCHEALEFDHVCVICATPAEASRM